MLALPWRSVLMAPRWNSQPTSAHTGVVSASSRKFSPGKRFIKNMLRITTGNVSTTPTINRLRLRRISACLRRLCSSSFCMAAAGASIVAATSPVPSADSRATCCIALYPTASTFCTICSTLVSTGSKVTAACSVAKLTLASFTPSTFLSPFSIRMAQEAQVIPCRSSVT